MSWARSKLAFLDSQPTLAAAVQILKIPAKTIGQLIRWHMASTIKIKIQRKIQNNNTEGENNEQEQEQEQEQEHEQEQEQEQEKDENVFKQWKQRPSERTLAALFKAAQEGAGVGEGEAAGDGKKDLGANTLASAATATLMASSSSLTSISVPSFSVQALQALCAQLLVEKEKELPDDAKMLNQMIASFNAWAR